MRWIATQRAGLSCRLHMPNVAKVCSSHFGQVNPRWVSKRWYPIVMPIMPNTKWPKIASTRPDQVNNQGMNANSATRCTLVRTTTYCHMIRSGSVSSGTANAGDRCPIPEVNPLRWWNRVARVLSYSWSPHLEWGQCYPAH